MAFITFNFGKFSIFHIIIYNKYNTNARRMQVEKGNKWLRNCTRWACVRRAYSPVLPKKKEKTALLSGKRSLCVLMDHAERQQMELIVKITTDASAISSILTNTKSTSAKPFTFLSFFIFIRSLHAGGRGDRILHRLPECYSWTFYELTLCFLLFIL